MTRGKRRSLAEDMRRAIEESGITMYKLSQDSGVDRSQLSRFMRNERDLSLTVADKLCEVLGMKLTRDGNAAPDLAPDQQEPAAGTKPRARPQKEK
jgi:transcriptional regulator with XRE-family HTH domain